MATVRVRHGSEGPAHDPYGYTEIVFTTTRGKVFKFRSGGLGYERYTGPRGGKIESYERWRRSLGKYSMDLRARRAFEKGTGMSPFKAERIPEILRARRLRSMNPEQRRVEFEIERIDAEMLRNAY